MLQSICVFCGSKAGADPQFAAAARALGTYLAETGRTLVYGGGRVGLMGILADATLAGNGRVIGVIPDALAEKEVVHSGLTDLKVVGSMHERKALMAELSDGFVAMPGGIGTLEELFEVWTWGQLGLHAKPYGLLDVAGFYQPLLDFLEQLVTQQFLKAEARELLQVAAEPRALLDLMAASQPRRMKRWLDRSNT